MAKRVSSIPPPPGTPRRSKNLSTMESHLVATASEFAGTFMFLFMGYAGNVMAASQAASQGPAGSGVASDQVVYTALAYSISLLVSVWTFYRISGGLFNPAVTLSLYFSGAVPWLRTVLFVPAQLTAAMCAGGLVEAMIPGGVAKANTTLAPATSTAQGLFLEMFFTSQLVFAVHMLAQEKSRDTYIAPLGIGLAVFSALLPGVYYTGGSLNPARSFGCAVASRTFPGYHWIYWLGPVLGAILATAFFYFVKYFHYEEVNPGQDAPHEDPSENP